MFLASPLTTAFDSRVAVARAHAAWTAAAASKDTGRALAAVLSVAGADRRDEAVRGALMAMDLWRVEALMRGGRPDLAAEALSEAERVYQPSHRSRFIAAQLSYFHGDFAAAAAACGDAMVLLPPTKKPAAAYSEIARFWADALCLDDRHAEARRLLERCFAFKDWWTTDDIKALRKTVTDEASLDDFRAFLAPYFSQANVRSRAALYHYSMACRDLGFYDRAEMAIRRRFVTGAGLTPFGHRPPSTEPRTSWVADARTTLGDLKAVMDGAGVEFFLISGTLLGAVREGDILGHDKDIDVGVMETPSLDKPALEQAFRDSGRFSVKPYQVPTLLRVQHASGVMIDVFWHRDEGGLIVHEGMKSKWWNSAFELADIDFLGATHRMPADFARYLAENYGNWDRPDAEFETFVDTPNMVVTSAGEIVWYFYCKLFDYYNQGKTAQFRKVAEALGRVRPTDHEVDAIVQRTLSHHAPAAMTTEGEEVLDEIVFSPLGSEAPSAKSGDEATFEEEAEEEPA